MLLNLLDAERQHQIAVAVFDLLFRIIFQRDPRVPARFDSQVLGNSFGTEQAFFREEDAADARLVEATEQLIDLLLGVVLQSHEAQEDLVLLDLAKLLLFLFDEGAVEVAITVVIEVWLVFWRCLGKFLISALLLVLVAVHHGEDVFVVLLRDRLVTEPNRLILLIPLRQDILKLTAHIILNVLDLAATPKVSALVEYYACLAARERLNTARCDVLDDRGQDVAKASLPLHLVHFHELVVDEDELLVSDLLELCDRLGVRIFNGPIGYLDLVLRIDALVDAVVVVNTDLGEGVVVDVAVDDNISLRRFLALLDSLVARYVPKLLDVAALSVALLAVANATRQAAEAVLMRLCFLPQHVVEVEPTPLDESLNDNAVIDVVIDSLSLDSIASSPLSVHVVDGNLLQRKDFLELLLTVGQLWIFCVHDGQAEGLERVNVVEVFRLLLEVVYLFFLHRELVMLEVDHLLLADLVEQRDLVHVFQVLGDDALLVDEGEDCQTRHLRHDILVRIDTCKDLVPKYFETVPVEIAVLKVVLFVKLIRRLVLATSLARMLATRLRLELPLLPRLIALLPGILAAHIRVLVERAFL